MKNLFTQLKFGQTFLAGPNSIPRTIHQIGDGYRTIIRHDDSGKWYLRVRLGDPLWSKEVLVI